MLYADVLLLAHRCIGAHRAIRDGYLRLPSTHRLIVVQSFMRRLGRLR